MNLAPLPVCCDRRVFVTATHAASGAAPRPLLGAERALHGDIRRRAYISRRLRQSRRAFIACVARTEAAAAAAAATAFVAAAPTASAASSAFAVGGGFPNSLAITRGHSIFRRLDMEELRFLAHIRMFLRLKWCSTPPDEWYVAARWRALCPAARKPAIAAAEPTVARNCRRCGTFV